MKIVYRANQMGSLVHNADCQHCRLAGLCLPNGMDNEEMSQLEAIVKRRRPLNPDEYLYRQADQAESLYVVKTGSFRSVILEVDGTEQTDDFYLPGGLMGLDALQGGTYRCSVVALETATVCELPLARLIELCTKIPSLQSQLLNIIGLQIAYHHDRIALVGNPSASEKMAIFLLMLSKHFSAMGYSSTEFNLTMQRHDIASFLSLSIETVSRQLTRMKKSGVISVKRRGIQINNLDLLKAML